MPDYDFHTLSPLDFEILTRDLLQARDGVLFQSFKSGRDGGVDLRYASDGENRIVQAKHLRKSGYRALVRAVRAEAAKVAKMRPPPSRYYLVTSVELSNDNKTELAAILGIGDTADILGSEDLNNLLGLNKDVELRHYKLWVSSTAVLQRVLHNAQALQTAFDYARIQDNRARFAQTRAFDHAKAKLEAERILILSGNPGVGKTTIADNLLYEKFADGYDPAIARNSLAEVRHLLQPGERRIFYYDDFLGATFLGEGGSPLVRNEDRAITDFIAAVARDPDKLLILTTREHILSDALLASERLRHAMVTDHRYVVEVGAYTTFERAHILYNHAFASDLPDGLMDQLLADDFYQEIIDHPKYAPRIVEWLTSPRRLQTCLQTGYADFARRLLDDPSEIWKHAYEQQISEAGRSLLLALHSLDGEAPHAALEEAFTQLHAGRCARWGFASGPSDFRTALRVLSGAFIRVGPWRVEFLDPSVRDLMNAVLTETPENAIDVLSGALWLDQVQTIWTLASRTIGDPIKSLMARRTAQWVRGVLRALEAPSITKDGLLEIQWLPGIEERLALAAELAVRFDLAELKAQVPNVAEQTKAIWASNGPDFPAALHVLHLLKTPQFDGLVTREQWRELWSALVRQTHYTFEPADVVALIELERQPSDADREALSHVAYGWASDMGDRIRDCRRRDDLELLRHNLRICETVLSIELRGPMNGVKTELAGWEEDETRSTSPTVPWDHRPTRDERHVRRYAADLFDTLRKNDET
ncbi:restriction endonuclease [Caulobacter segnis]|uniref:nSTAND3 domain-containing NTPase n=1 Tax=Caulobacter segnis TaxID=88688 RepID=UPI001CBC00B4|nr:restriction endonuclease [Caulobacter segnis]UAL10207.1 restriction endonuclease [Caulobacter segnis]